mmetsp:Transcript_21027/g.58241  ORF Transcript_21027/g.58241 Transcript_21027/m.58241 type:complete len:144 (-) Transcript_21027:415-846(-)
MKLVSLVKSCVVAKEILVLQATRLHYRFSPRSIPYLERSNTVPVFGRREQNSKAQSAQAIPCHRKLKSIGLVTRWRCLASFGAIQRGLPDGSPAVEKQRPLSGLIVLFPLTDVRHERTFNWLGCRTNPFFIRNDSNVKAALVV